jgi:PPOX class probable F420-dependent enzyme
MTGDRCRELFAGERVARLATIGPGGPRIVPITFALVSDHIVTAIDDKPKTTTRLRRLTDIANNPRVAVLADHYEDAWDRLWWVRADGVAEVFHSGPIMDDALDELAVRYRQYRDERPDGPVIAIAVTQWSGWAAEEAE